MKAGTLGDNPNHIGRDLRSYLPGQGRQRPTRVGPLATKLDLSGDKFGSRSCLEYNIRRCKEGSETPICSAINDKNVRDPRSNLPRRVAITAVHCRGSGSVCATRSASFSCSSSKSTEINRFFARLSSTTWLSTLLSAAIAALNEAVASPNLKNSDCTFPRCARARPRISLLEAFFVQTLRSVLLPLACSELLGYSVRITNQLSPRLERLSPRMVDPCALPRHRP